MNESTRNRSREIQNPRSKLSKCWQNLVITQLESIRTIGEAPPIPIHLLTQNLNPNLNVNLILKMKPTLVRNLFGLISSGGIHGDSSGLLIRPVIIFQTRCWSYRTHRDIPRKNHLPVPMLAIYILDIRIWMAIGDRLAWGKIG